MYYVISGPAFVGTAQPWLPVEGYFLKKGEFAVCAAGLPIEAGVYAGEWAPFAVAVFGSAAEAEAEAERRNRLLAEAKK